MLRPVLQPPSLLLNVSMSLGSDRDGSIIYSLQTSFKSYGVHIE
jgi:hypothetical protein